MSIVYVLVHVCTGSGAGGGKSRNTFESNICRQFACGTSKAGNRMTGTCWMRCTSTWDTMRSWRTWPGTSFTTPFSALWAMTRSFSCTLSLLFLFHYMYVLCTVYYLLFAMHRSSTFFPFPTCLISVIIRISLVLDSWMSTWISMQHLYTYMYLVGIHVLHLDRNLRTVWTRIPVKWTVSPSIPSRSSFSPLALLTRYVCICHSLYM